MTIEELKRQIIAELEKLTEQGSFDYLSALHNELFCLNSGDYEFVDFEEEPEDEDFVSVFEVKEPTKILH